MKKILFGLALISTALYLTACNCRKEREEIKHEIPSTSSEVLKSETVTPEAPKTESSTEIK